MKNYYQTQPRFKHIEGSKSAYGNYVHKQIKNKEDIKTNLNRSNHVLKTDLSKNGQPFCFKDNYK